MARARSVPEAGSAPGCRARVIPKLSSQDREGGGERRQTRIAWMDGMVGEHKKRPRLPLSPPPPQRRNKGAWETREGGHRSPANAVLWSWMSRPVVPC